MPGTGTQVQVSSGDLSSRFSDVSNFVDSKIAQANTLVTDMTAKLDTYMNQLADAATESLPYIADQDASSAAVTIVDTAMPPAAPDLVLTVPEFTAVREQVTVPVLGEIGAVPEFVDPGLDLTWNWSEVDYVSSLLQSLKDKMALDLQGGTGLNATVEAAIYARARSRMEDEYASEYAQITGFYSSRGLSAPSGVIEARVRALNTKYARLYADLDRDVMIKQAELEMDNRKFVEQLITQLETALMNYHGAMNQRALDAESSRLAAAVQIYNSKATVYNTLVSAFKTTAEIELAKVESALKQLEMAARAYESDVSAYVAQVNANVSLVKGEAEIYSAVVEGYSARAAVVKNINDTNLGKYKLEIDRQAQNITLDLKRADIQLSGVLQQMTLQVEAIKAQANITAEIIAAALNSVNTGAQVSYSAGEQVSTSEQASISESYNNEVTAAP